METKKDEKKNEKKGFWASVFAPKPCSCSCGGSVVEEIEDGEEKNAPQKKEKTSDDDKKGNSCSCV